jgi:molybdopterin converting factor small subunit
MKLDVKLFAQARDLAGSEQVQVELSDTACVADLNWGRWLPAC